MTPTVHVRSIIRVFHYLFPVAGGIVLLESGCASQSEYPPYNTIVPTASDSTTIEVHENTTVITSSQKSEAIIKLVQPVFGPRHAWYPTLFVGILNRSSQPILFSTKSIRVTSGAKKAYLYSPEQMEGFAKKDAEEAKEALAMNMSEAMDDDWSTPNDHRATRPMPPADAYVLRMNLIDKAYNQKPMDILAANQVMPGKFAGGLVGIMPGDIDPKQPLVILVKLSGEIHKFTFHLDQKW